MDTVFPLGFPASTVLYLVFYVATLVLHVVFMNYVLAGSLYLAWATVMPVRNANSPSRSRLALTLRDWLPFSLSAAITAGVAPLLFVQILYRREFYTANLLLSWRWMLVIPVLIGAFYLLYLLKGKAIDRWPHAVRAAIGIGVAGCFLFVGFCWTANHLLSISRDAWPGVYISADLTSILTNVVPRLFTWSAGSFAAMAMLAGWQLYWKQRRLAPDEFDDIRFDVNRLACAAIGGLVVATISGLVLLSRLDGELRGILLGVVSLPYFIAAFVGVLIQIAAWLVMWRLGRFSASCLCCLTFGCLATLLSATVMREVIRLTRVDIDQLLPVHAHASEIDGFAAFLGFFVINAFLISLCVWLVRKHTKQADQ